MKLADKNVQLEWDHGSYQRKFQSTLAYIKVGENFPEWRWIGALSDNSLVYGDPRENPIGQYVSEYEREIHLDPEKYPIVQFLYRLIRPGAYRSKGNESKMYLLTKRHCKSYKIGLSDETYNVRSAYTEVGANRVGSDIDLTQPITTYTKGMIYEVYSRQLVRMGTSLYADGDDVGFMDGGVCVLRHPTFVPLVKPFLENKWQIASL